MSNNFDYERARQAAYDLLCAIGEDPSRPGLEETPDRVARAWSELSVGLHEDPGAHLEKQFEVGTDEIVLIRDIPFYSVCEHHLLPFFGMANVAYLPSHGKVTGLSKIARCVEGFARKPQVQERLTAQIADAIADKLHAAGVAVVLEGEHLCMTMRGIKKPGAKTVTSALRGQMRRNQATRAEVLRLITH
ncbi:GTP cyclohydrolase I FolE [Winkia neuii]|uniref:GTP cyclohydrolase 1 n=1 Tax=Winkia neuii subsp. anitrata TaxID=29318 RepID=A0AB38XMU9_9ACTO|nr:GTP cyclohydrolase I FolE [Winkia neuii]WCE45682.1 GTP cyclohydrolase I FolE [Winkia neuii subsp. anitrata]